VGRRKRLGEDPQECGADLQSVGEGGGIHFRILSSMGESQLSCNAANEGIEFMLEGGVGVVEDEVVGMTTPGVLIGDIHLLAM
jgi:hypothetical protein